jgi:hypothetical protein
VASAADSNLGGFDWAPFSSDFDLNFECSITNGSKKDWQMLESLSSSDWHRVGFEAIQAHCFGHFAEHLGFEPAPVYLQACLPLAAS